MLSKEHEETTNSRFTRSPCVSLIILSYNSGKFWDLFNRCVGSLVETEYSAFEVIMVDNGSSDDSVDRISKIYPSIKIVKLPRNIGWCAGNNSAVFSGTAIGELLVFLNSDVVVERNWLKPLVSCILASDKHGSAGPLGRFRTLGGVDLDPVPRLSRTYYADHCSGYCIMVKRDVFLLVKGFNPTYSFYWDDADFAERIRALGYLSIAVPSSIVRHYPGSTIESNRLDKMRAYLLSRNMFYVACQNSEATLLPVSIVLMVLNRFRRSLTMLAMSRADLALSVISGTISGVAKMAEPTKYIGRRGFKDPERLPIVMDFFYLFLNVRSANKLAQRMLRKSIRLPSIAP